MRIAVLTDGENVSYRLAKGIFAQAERLGHAPIRVVYGDFSGSASGWRGVAARYALTLELVVPTSKGKNGADIALTVGAMDLLGEREMDGICIVSSDGDFAALAGRIRRAGCIAYGLGEAKTTLLCREAYTEFHLLGSNVMARVANSDVLEAVRAVAKDCPQQGGWTTLSDFGKRAKAQGLTPNAYGVAQWSKVLLATGQFVLDDGNQRFRSNHLKVAGGQ